MKLLDVIKNILIWGLIIFSLGYITYLHYHPITVEKVVEKPTVKETVVKEVVTKFEVKEKETPQDSDVVIKSKNDLKVTLNGKEVTLKPKDNEEFNFDKNYLELRQNSTTSIHIDNNPLEPTWGIGIGISSNKKVAGIATVRIKDSPFHVWVMSDGHSSAGGVMFSTNYK